MLYGDFVNALQQVAQRKYPAQPTPAMALSLLLSRDILPQASKQKSDEHASELLGSEVKVLFKKYNRTLQEVC